MDRMSNTALLKRIADRRERLGMSYAVLAQRSGVSMPTLKRMLHAGSGEKHSPRLDCLSAVLEALGMSLTAQPEITVEELRQQEAEAKARRLVGLVQGTSALEAQGLDQKEIERLIAEAQKQLLAGSSRRLWAS